jgi:hypothetical protein
MAVITESPFTKQPSEIKYFDIHCEDFLTALGTTAVGIPTVAWDSTEVVQTNPPSWVLPGVLRIWSSGGLHLKKYKATIMMACATGWVEESEVILAVKEF